VIDVRRVQGRREFRRFVDYAYDRNRSDPHWVPPLRMAEHERLTPRKNPFFAHADVELFLAWRGNRIAGRIAAIDDRLHNERHGDNIAMFGFFEADDAAATQALMETVEAWAKGRGRAAMRGPINPSLNESAGLLVDGFDSDPMLMMPHNPREYAAFLEAAGYRKIKDLFAWLYDVAGEPPPVIARLAQRLRAREGIVARPLRMSEFFDRMTKMLWGEVGGASPVAFKALEGPGTRRDVQRAYVDILAAMVATPAPGTPDDARALAEGRH
jgi:hypothetical protein